jgi:hypothetical protein
MSKVGFCRAMLPALIAGLCVCGSVPGISATDVNSDRKPRAGSQYNQTLLVTESISPITAWVNGKRVGDFQAGNKLDISNFIRSGENTLRITWQNSTWPFSVRVAHAENKNAFRDVSRVSVGTLNERRQMEKEVQFVLP